MAIAEKTSNPISVIKTRPNGLFTMIATVIDGIKQHIKVRAASLRFPEVSWCNCDSVILPVAGKKSSFWGICLGVCYRITLEDWGFNLCFSASWYNSASFVINDSTLIGFER